LVKVHRRWRNWTATSIQLKQRWLKQLRRCLFALPDGTSLACLCLESIIRRRGFFEPKKEALAHLACGDHPEHKATHLWKRSDDTTVSHFA
jgi:hypothetical protein